MAYSFGFWRPSMRAIREHGSPRRAENGQYLMQIEALAKRMSLSDQALERIIDVIVRGDLKPGERVQEAVLARQLGISRGPLREAIRQLEGRNLVVRTPHVGVRIADPSPPEILDIFLIREALEGVASRLATERMSDREIGELELVLSEHGQQADVKAGGGYYQGPGDRDFHFKIIKGSRSQRLADMLLGDLYHFLRIFRYRSSVKPGRARTAHEEHKAVLDAVKARDGVAAETAMRRHLQLARLSLAETFAENENRLATSAAGEN